MADDQAKLKIHNFYRKLCVCFVKSIRALSLYPQGHLETETKVADFFQMIRSYLNQRPKISLLHVNNEILVEDIVLPELKKSLGKFIQQMETIKLQRIIFRRGLSVDELILFLQLLTRLMNKTTGADLVLAKNQRLFPHIFAGSSALYSTPQDFQKGSLGILYRAEKSVLAISGQIKDLFSDINGPLSMKKVSMAKKITSLINLRTSDGLIPLKILFHRRSSSPDPFIHAFNVSALSMALARQFDLNKSIILETGLGALLHDIGLHLSHSFYLSKTASTSMNEKKQLWENHIRGAEILLATPGIPGSVPLVAYEQNIYFNGQGCPGKERYRYLNMAGMITCIVNYYDNLRRNRPEQKALSLTEAVNRMNKQTGAIFHPLIYKQFRVLVKAETKKEL